MRSMASASSIKGIVAVVGVGPKLGRSIARKFAHEGYTVAILARDLGQPMEMSAVKGAPHTPTAASRWHAEPIPNPRSNGREVAISQRPPGVFRLAPQVSTGRRTPRLRSPLPPPRYQSSDLLLCCINPRRFPPLPNHQNILQRCAAAPPLRARRLLQGVALQLANGAPLCELVVRKGEF
ncbi:hypothetical protein MRB53_033623 [Persea americana]|uniref:Uncharacterized protein n=1 Tax=Persea americana TaxID=3435 RepID=A0ACC2KVS1_PERAE|nr:hypothetical protein MRB53_033623 [Persea americana]